MIKFFVMLEVAIKNTSFISMAYSNYRYADITIIYIVILCLLILP